MSDLSPTTPPRSLLISLTGFSFSCSSPANKRSLLLLSSDEDDEEEEDGEDDDDDEALRVLLPRFVVGRVLHFFSRRDDVRFWGGLHREKRWRNKRKRNVLEK